LKEEEGAAYVSPNRPSICGSGNSRLHGEGKVIAVKDLGVPGGCGQPRAGVDGVDNAAREAQVLLVHDVVDARVLGDGQSVEGCLDLAFGETAAGKSRVNSCFPPERHIQSRRFWALWVLISSA